MFEFGRELRRFFSAPAVPPKDGMTGGDACLLELLDMKMLRAEGKAAGHHRDVSRSGPAHEHQPPEDAAGGRR